MSTPTRCAICGQPLRLADDDVAEMVDPFAADSVICHIACGRDIGLELA